jgi:pantetheine-phosphate adenylyltransferase
MMEDEQSYDVILTLRLHSLASLSEYRSLIEEAASATSSRLLILLPSTTLWASLLSDRANSFEVVQNFLSQSYVLAQSKLKQEEEDASVDIVIEALRGTAVPLPEGGVKHLEYEDQEQVEQRNGIDESAKEKNEGPAMGTVALGGTFDHLHSGHKILLTMACWLAQRRTIVGITGARRLVLLALHILLT